MRIRGAAIREQSLRIAEREGKDLEDVRRLYWRVPRSVIHLAAAVDNQMALLHVRVGSPRPFHLLRSATFDPSWVQAALEEAEVHADWAAHFGVIPAAEMWLVGQEGHFPPPALESVRQ